MSEYKREVLSGPEHMLNRIPAQPPQEAAPAYQQQPMQQPMPQPFPQPPAQQMQQPPQQSYPGYGAGQQPKKKFPIWIVVVAAVVVVGVVAGIVLLSGGGGGLGGGGLSGTYEYVSSSNWTLTFKSGGVVEIYHGGMKMNMNYTVSGSDITFTRQSDDLKGMYLQEAESFEEKGGVIDADGSIYIGYSQFIKE